MGLISLDQISKGMVLASDVRDLNGRLLAVKGASLTDGHLKVFRTWGILEADIVGLSGGDALEEALVCLDRGLLKTAEERVRHRFVNSDLEHPANRRLFQHCTLKEVERLRRAKPILLPGRRFRGCTEGKSANMSRKGNHRIDPVSFVRDDVSLPALPIIIFEILETIKNPKSSPRQIANVLSKDVSLSALILELVNSSFYGFPSKIDTLSRAVLVLGTKQLTTLAMGIKLATVFKDIPSTLVDMKSFLEHSITCGILARILGAFKNIQNTERLFLGGLLHDIGRLVLYSRMPLGAKEALLLAERDGIPLYEAESAIFGSDHANVGRLLLKRWKLPVSLEAAVGYHHAPQEYKDPLETSLVHLADILTNAVGSGSSGERLVPSLNKAAWECVGLSVRILLSALEQMEVQREEVLSHLISCN